MCVCLQLCVSAKVSNVKLLQSHLSTAAPGSAGDPFQDLHEDAQLEAIMHRHMPAQVQWPEQPLLQTLHLLSKRCKQRVISQSTTARCFQCMAI